jgi:hypothetical protein
MPRNPITVLILPSTALSAAVYLGHPGRVTGNRRECGLNVMNSPLKVGITISS